MLKQNYIVLILDYVRMKIYNEIKEILYNWTEKDENTLIHFILNIYEK